MYQISDESTRFRGRLYYFLIIIMTSIKERDFLSGQTKNNTVLLPLGGGVKLMTVITLVWKDGDITCSTRAGIPRARSSSSRPSKSLSAVYSWDIRAPSSTALPSLELSPILHSKSSWGGALSKEETEKVFWNFFHFRFSSQPHCTSHSIQQLNYE